MPPRGASEEEKLAYEAKFNLRASWRLTRHAGPDADGATVAVSILFGVASEPGVPEHDAELADCPARGRRSRALLRGDPDGHTGGAAVVAEHHGSGRPRGG